MKRASLELLALAGLFGAVGAVIPHLRDPSDERGLSFLLSIASSILLFMWCKAHAAARGIEPPTPSALLVGLMAPGGVPYYFFRSMAWPAACWATLKAIGYLIGILSLSGICEYYSSRIG